LAESTRKRFEQIRGRRMRSPAFRERYEHTSAVIASLQELLAAIDSTRAARGLSKAELARQAGMQPAAVRRLLGSGASNPTLHTVLELMAALGIKFHIHPAECQATSSPSRAPRGSSAAGTPARTHLSV
jgi:DNA-binding phage protein